MMTPRLCKRRTRLPDIPAIVSRDDVKILIIDDDDLLRGNIQDLLELEGHTVCSAADGRQGIQAMSVFCPDLVLCDIMMRDLDGYEVLRTLRADARLASTPLIFLTARAEKSDIQAGIQQGASAYITKPFTRNQLIGAIETVTGSGPSGASHSAGAT